MTPEATVRVAVDMVNEGLISKKTALSRIDPAQLEFFYSDMIDSEGTSTPVFCKGLVISPGVDIFYLSSWLLYVLCELTILRSRIRKACF